MLNRFARLLEGFSALAASDRASDSPLTNRFRNLLTELGGCRVRSDKQEQAESAADHNRFQAMLRGYEAAVKQDRHLQEATADDFNLLEVMNLTGKEIRHSMVLAWLLDRDYRKLGTHAQGSLGFRLFLAEFGLPLEYADSKYWVRREVAGDESIVDVEIACRGQFIIHIENKIWSGEGDDDQTVREWNDLVRRAIDLNVANTHALFLTPHGKKPLCDKFHAIPWGRVVRVLEQFADRAKPPDVKLFARHYAQALQRFIVIQDRIEENDGKSTTE